MSQFVVSARKYRPQRFDEVVGQSHVSDTLKNALADDKLAHAFLFCGPRGVGKTTCARILAKAINCQNPKEDHEACNECDSCTAFLANTSFNIIELDAASNNSVDNIRSLVDQVRIPPQKGKYKVFIIDEVHMLSQAAFNAFLKTLEEPPAYAIFILATTEKHKILPTILSRCQIFDFRRIALEDMILHLASICKEENVEAEEEALHIIAQKADGALRDALSIFDRVISGSHAKLTYANIIDQLNVLDYDYYFRITDALLTGDVESVLLIFDEIQKKGFDGDLFITGLAGHFRDLLVSRKAITTGLLEVPDQVAMRYQDQAQLASPAFLVTALTICNECDVQYRLAKQKRLHVEMSLIKLAHIVFAIKVPIPELQKKNIVESASRGAKVVEARPQEQGKQSAFNELSQGAPKREIEASSTQENSAILKSKEEKESITKKDEPLELKVSKPKIPSLGSLPSLKSIEALDAVAHKEQEQAKKQTAQKPTLKSLKEVWEEYTKQHESPSVQNVLNGADLSVTAEGIYVTVGSRLGHEIIKGEKQLLEKIRKKYSDQTLVLNIIVDSDRQVNSSNQPKKVWSVKETYQDMLNQNPSLDLLREAFDLKPSEDS